MTNNNQPPGLREAVGYFTTAAALQEAIDELLTSGFNRAELSLLASEDAVKKKLGHIYGSVEEIEDDDQIPRSAYISRESVAAGEAALIGTPLYIAATLALGVILASGGTLAAAMAGAAAAGGAGGIAGSVLAALLGNERAKLVEEQLDHGGLLLWVRTWNDADEKRASDIMARHSGHDVHIHTVNPA